MFMNKIGQVLLIHKYEVGFQRICQHFICYTIEFEGRGWLSGHGRLPLRGVGG